MMELNRGQIIKALECCYMQELEHNENCPECPYTDLYPNCAEYLGKHALALITSQEQRIKELTEDNERLRGIGTPDDKAYIRLSDAKNAIMDYIGEQTVSKYASEAECKAARSGAEGAMNELDYITPVKVAPIADTVRKMQERLKKRLDGNGWDIAVAYAQKIVDQIAKEMVEEK